MLIFDEIKRSKYNLIRDVNESLKKSVCQTKVFACKTNINSWVEIHSWKCQNKYIYRDNQDMN